MKKINNVSGKGGGKMKKLQHTPGPWFVDSGLIINNGISDISMIFIGDIDNSEEIEKSKTDARLIAAAPEMLEALITTYKAFNTDGHDHDCGQPCEGCECFSSCPNITVKQAIEKATGMSIEKILK